MDINKIRSTEFAASCRNAENCFVRKRKMPLTDLLFTMINRKGLTLTLELRNYMKLSHPGTEISKPGYLKQHFFVRKNDLTEKYGLCKPQISSAKMLFYIPLIILSTANLWHGVVLNTSPVETLLYIVSMLFVSFLEEMIFRGFLFNVMAKNNEKSAIIVSSVTFGMVHIVNLIKGNTMKKIINLRNGE